MLFQRSPTVACYRDGILNPSQPELSSCPCTLAGLSVVPLIAAGPESSMVVGWLELSCCFLVLRVVTSCCAPGAAGTSNLGWLTGGTDTTRG